MSLGIEVLRGLRRKRRKVSRPIRADFTREEIHSVAGHLTEGHLRTLFMFLELKQVGVGRIYKSMAKAMHRPVGTVCSRLHRARKALSRQLEAEKGRRR